MKVVSKTLSLMLVVAVAGIAENIKPVTANIQLAQTSTQVTTTVKNSPISLALPTMADIKLKNGESMTARVSGFDSKGQTIEFSLGKESKLLSVTKVQQIVFKKDQGSLVYTGTGEQVIRGEDHSKATQSVWSDIPLEAFELFDSQKGQARVNLATVKKPKELLQIRSVAVKSLYIADEIEFSSKGKMTIKVTPVDKKK
ncbi:MAG: hypothetical protein AN488_20550 [Anabaena sp. WA113]|jgi:hypothetical protein|uniref:hypothetical protein n=1 Tax=Dolichospermum lemmermannii TaxID=54295 RepID=UPI0007FC6C34|nr:hypothetical protein [Dolichospermum lemmermannii]MDB9437979.1 hypothetical protein [Dolichospermum lemmermannii CS-548]OBQ15753.1 MAG: hypothetical protein AN488_20550 [Anabaena sp. WA113]